MFFRQFISYQYFSLFFNHPQLLSEDCQLSLVAKLHAIHKNTQDDNAQQKSKQHALISRQGCTTIKYLQQYNKLVASLRKALLKLLPAEKMLPVN